jgi:hypothetical protein
MNVMSPSVSQSSSSLSLVASCISYINISGVHLPAPTRIFQSINSLNHSESLFKRESQNIWREPIISLEDA